jgi:LemA protein
MTAAYIAIGAGIVLLAWAALSFNALVTAHNRVNESWSGVDVQLARRHDLVPNLIETVRAYAVHERATLAAATEVCATAGASSGRRGRQAAEYELSETVADLRAVAERYPELQSTEHFRRLQGQLAEVEGEIQYSRRIYNSNVLAFNTRVRSFPGSLVRRFGGFRAMGYFELNPVWRSAAIAAESSEEPEAAAAA